MKLKIYLSIILLFGSNSLAISGGSNSSTGAHPYIGVSFGNVDSDFSRNDDLGLKLFGGYRINRNFAAEAGYVNFGDETGSRGQDTLYVSVLGIAPINNQFSIFGKVGFHSWDDDVRNSDGTDLMWGFGVSYKLDKKISFRLEHEIFEDAAVDEISLTSVGVSIAF